MRTPIVKDCRQFDSQRRVVAYMTTESWQAVPHVAFVYEPDVTDLVAVLSLLVGRGTTADSKPTMNTVMLKVIAEALKKAPVLNAHVDYSHAKVEGSLCIKDEIDIAIPWLLPDGRMITPTIRDCGRKSLADIGAAVSTVRRKLELTNVDELLHSAIVDNTVNQVKNLKLSVCRRILAAAVTRRPFRVLRGKEKHRYYALATECRLTKEDLLDATVSVSNVGSLYKDLRGNLAMLQIIPPQIFAVGISALHERPGVHVNSAGHKTIVPRTYLPMTLVFDHRAIDFSAIIPFIKECDDIFAHPARIADTPTNAGLCGSGGRV